MQGLFSEVWEQAALHQCVPPVCEQAGAAAQSQDSWLPEHTAAPRGGHSQCGSPHLSTGAQCREGQEQNSTSRQGIGTGLQTQFIGARIVAER